MHARKRNAKVNLPSYVKTWFMGSENRQFRTMWANAIAFSANGARKVAAADAYKTKGVKPDAQITAEAVEV